MSQTANDIYNTFPILFGAAALTALMIGLPAVSAFGAGLAACGIFGLYNERPRIPNLARVMPVFAMAGFKHSK